jgi:hypothetical protein
LAAAASSWKSWNCAGRGADAEDDGGGDCEEGEEEEDEDDEDGDGSCGAGKSVDGGLAVGQPLTEMARRLIPSCTTVDRSCRSLTLTDVSRFTRCDSFMVGLLRGE